MIHLGKEQTSLFLEGCLFHELQVESRATRQKLETVLKFEPQQIVIEGRAKHH